MRVGQLQLARRLADGGGVELWRAEKRAAEQTSHTREHQLGGRSGAVLRRDDRDERRDERRLQRRGVLGSGEQQRVHHTDACERAAPLAA